MHPRSGPDITRKLDFLAEIYRLQGTFPLTETITRRLPDLIACDNVMIGGHDGTRRMMTGIVLRHPFTRSHFLSEANQTGLMGRHPFWQRLLDPGNPLKILSEMAPGRRWLENPFFREVLREDRVRDHLNIEFGDSPADFTSISVIRSTVGFSAADRETMRLLAPHFQQAFTNARTADTHGLGTPASGSTQGYRIGLCGAWLDAPDHLHALFGSGSATLPDHLTRWLHATTDRLNRGFHTDRSLALRNGARAHEFRLERDWFGRCYRLFHRLTSLPGELLGQPLSKKEHEVLFWVREGKSNPEIATLLGVSPETIKTHLKRIYRKLGVDNRTAAAHHGG